MDLERRESQRYRVWFPMNLRTADGDEGTAITFDASPEGLLMASVKPLPIGTSITLCFKLPQELEERRVAAEVVRVMENEQAPGPWLYKMAVKFAAPDPELKPLLESAAELDQSRGN